MPKKKPSMKPFDQADYETPDMMPRTADGRPDLAGYVAQGTTRAALNLHTNRTLERALKALENPWKWAGQHDALEILTAAEPQYRRLGGKIPFWTEVSK